MKNEPVITVAAVTSAVVAVLSLLAAFGLNVSDDQRNAIVGVVAISAPLVAGFLARRHVTPVAKVEGD